MNLKSLLEVVKQKDLTLEQLEDYRDEMVHLHTLMQLELADIEREGALFLVDSKEESHAAKKRVWKATDKGLREITLNRYLKAVVKELDSLKSRVYSLL